MHAAQPLAAPAWRTLAGALALAGLLAAPAQAALVSPLTLSLVSPGGVTTDGVNILPFVTLSDSVDPAVGIVAGDGSNIGGFMLPGESIGFLGNSIMLHVAAGAALANGDLTSGYLGAGGAHARYQFDDLQIAGQTIVGYTLSMLGVASGGHVDLGGAHSLSLWLDDLVFAPNPLGESFAGGDFRIDLLTRPVVQPPDNGVPEPAGWALVAVALVALRLVPRRRTA